MSDQNNALDLANISETGEVPKARLSDPAKAQEVVGILLQANRERIRKNAMFKGAIDGNAPYNADQLRAHGQANRTNVNWGEAEASVDAAMVPYYDLLSGTEHYARIETDFGPDEVQGEISDIISEEFDRMLKDWSGFDFEMQAMMFDFVVYGRGFVKWPTRASWRFEWVRHDRVMVPDGTEAKLDNVDMLVIREKYTVPRLHAHIRNESAASEVGWNVAAVKKAMAHAVPDQTTSQIYDFEEIQQRIKDSDIYTGMRASVIKAAHVFVKEFDGKISHYIIAEESKAPAEYMFQSVGLYEGWNEVMATFFLKTWDGSWNGANGLARQIFSAIEAKNRLRCSMLDGAMLRTGITLQATDASGLQKMSMVQLGAFNIIPPGVAVQQSSILGDVQTAMAVNRDFDALIAQNTGTYKPKMDRPEGNPRTAREVELSYQSQAVLGNSAVNRFYAQLDRAHEEIYRRATAADQTGDDDASKAAKDFQKRCKDRGIPAQAMKMVRSVRAVRNIGNGSLFMRQQAMQQLMPMMPALPEAGRRALLIDVISTSTNHHTAMRYMGKQPQETPGRDTWDAVIENATLKEAAPVILTPEQNSVIHAQVHLKAGFEAMQSLEQGANPHAVLTFLEGIGQHTAEHLVKIEQDPSRKAVFKQLEGAWQQLAQATDKLRANIEKSEKAQQEQAQAQQQAQSVAQGNDPDSQIKMAKAQQDMQIKQAKSNQLLQQKDDKHRQNLAFSDAKTAVSLQNQQKMQAQKTKDNE